MREAARSLRKSQLPAGVRKKLARSAQRSVDAKIAKAISSAPLNEEDSKTTTVRVEIALNDGCKSRRKPFLVHSADFDAFTSAALKKLNVRGVSEPAVYDESGRRVERVADMVQGGLLLLSGKGEAFVPALNKRTAKERREAKAAAAAPAAPARSAQIRLDKVPLGVSCVYDEWLFVGSARDAATPMHLAEHNIARVLNVTRDVPLCKSVEQCIALPVSGVIIRFF